MTRAALLTPAEAADELRVPEAVILRFVSHGVIHASRQFSDGGVQHLIPRDEVDCMAEAIATLREGSKSNTPTYIAWGLPKEKVSGIYFALAGEYVKIGYASNITARFKDLQVAVPQELRLICWIDGTMADEQKLHKRFAACHVRGEWFRLDGDVAAYVAEYTRFYWGIRFE